MDTKSKASKNRAKLGQKKGVCAHTHTHTHTIYICIYWAQRAHPEACHLASARWFSLYLTHLLQVSYHSQVTNLEPTNIKNSPVKSDTSKEPNWTPCLVPSTEPRRPHQAFVSACCSHHLEHTWDCYPSLHCLCEGSSCFWCSYRPYQHSKWVSKQRGGELVGNTGGRELRSHPLGGCKEEKRQDPRGDSVGDMTALKTPGCRFNPPNPCKMVKESWLSCLEPVLL